VGPSDVLMSTCRDCVPNSRLLRSDTASLVVADRHLWASTPPEGVVNPAHGHGSPPRSSTGHLTEVVLTVYRLGIDA